jgi:bifunctional non-homologous end joining protein LigD
MTFVGDQMPCGDPALAVDSFWALRTITLAANIADESVAAYELPARSCVLAGEAIAVDDNGLSVFDLIRYRRQDHAVTLCAFDLLELDGGDLRGAPIETRKATLKGLLRRTHGGVAFSKHFEADGAIVYRHACALGCEGIVSVKREAEEEWRK